MLTVFVKTLQASNVTFASVCKQCKKQNSLQICLEYFKEDHCPHLGSCLDKGIWGE